MSVGAVEVSHLGVTGTERTPTTTDHGVERTQVSNGRRRDVTSTVAVMSEIAGDCNVAIKISIDHDLGRLDGRIGVNRF